MVFKDDFELTVEINDGLFSETSFKKLKDCLISIGEESFVVIGQDFNGKLERPIFRMKFPVNISWDEMMSGDFISMILFGFSQGEYMVYGQTSEWAKYTANDYIVPLDILAFKPKLRLLFHEKFKRSEIDRMNIKKALPDIYTDRVKLDF
jgi:hypothetical protein